MFHGCTMLYNVNVLFFSMKVFTLRSVWRWTPLQDTSTSQPSPLCPTPATSESFIELYVSTELWSPTSKLLGPLLCIRQKGAFIGFFICTQVLDPLNRDFKNNFRGIFPRFVLFIFTVRFYTFSVSMYFRVLFWTEIGPLPGIGRAHMDGTSREYIVSRDILVPNGLAIDYEGYIPSLLYNSCYTSSRDNFNN